MRVIGITGGIASGKTTAAAQLKTFGAKVFDADHFGHRVYEQDTVGFHAIVNEFGHDLVGEDGEIDRRILPSDVTEDVRKDIAQRLEPPCPRRCALVRDQLYPTGADAAFYRGITQEGIQRLRCVQYPGRQLDANCRTSVEMIQSNYDDTETLDFVDELTL